MDRKLSVLLCLSMALTLAGCAAEEEAPLMDPTVTVEVAEVQSGSLSNDGTYIGTISAEGTASVIPLVSGTVEEIAVSVGDTVNATMRAPASHWRAPRPPIRAPLPGSPARRLP